MHNRLVQEQVHTDQKSSAQEDLKFPRCNRRSIEEASNTGRVHGSLKQHSDSEFCARAIFLKTVS